MELVANFILNNDSLDAEFDVSEVQNFDALFEIYAGGVTWGNISGDLENQTDLQNELNTLSGAIDSNHQAITEINTTMQGYGDIVTHDVSEFATSAQGAKADSALQPNDNITELNNNAGFITSAAIGDGTLTIQVNNETVGTFTANQSGNTTANIEVPDSATWGNITGDIEDQTDLTTVLASKQDVLTPGTDIEITQDNTINFTNASGYITGINSTDVTNALGYTPYDAANPDKFLKNTATGTNSITVNGTAATSSQAINIGKGSSATKSNTVALGYNASASGSSSVAIGNSAGASTAGISGVAIGDGAKSQAQYAIQLGKGTNPVASTLSVGFGSNNYTLLNGSTGLIPNGRLSTGIARTSDMNAADDELQAQIDNLKARGRFLALWNCATGLAETNPTSSPYTYQTGDYFIIGTVSTATPPINYRPNGSSYTTGVASTTVETAAVDVDDVYYYDGTTWHLQINTQKTTAFVNIAGSPYDNTELAQALNSKADDSDITNLETEISAKQDALTPGTDIEITQNNTINFINSSGYITGITSSDVTTALGYTPYNSSNPDGYTDNVGTVTSVNNVQPDSSGNVTIPTGGTVDQTYDATSQNAQSGVAINGAKFLQNTANGTGSITINGTATNGNYAINIGNGTYTGGYAVSIGNGTSANGGYSVCLGNSAQSYGTSGIAIGRGAYINGSGVNGVAIGRDAKVQASNAIQLGKGTNTTANSMAVGFADIDGNGTAASYSMLDGTTGLIPDARISNNIARTSAIPTSSTVASWGFITGINSSDVITALGYTPYNSSNPSGYITGINSSDVTTALGYTPVNPSSLATVATSGSYNDLSNKPEIYSRNIGEIVTSTIPLTDAGLHLLDGSLIQGSGSYSAFVDYIAGLCDSEGEIPLRANVSIIGSLTNTNGIISDFTTTSYAQLPINFNPESNTWQMHLKFKTGTDITTTSYVFEQYYSIGVSVQSSKIILALGTGGSIWDLLEANISSATANTEYELDIIFNGTEYDAVYDIFLNGSKVRTVSIPGTIGSHVGYIGINNAHSYPFTGSIDLNECYINLNGSRWWSGILPYGFTDEPLWQNAVAQYGVCGKFVYDSANNTVRLPKITGVVEGTTDLTALGDLIEAGLPNITGGFNTSSFVDNNATGAFSSTGTVHNITLGTSGGSRIHADDFDASRSSDIYGNSATVQPQAIKVLYYIVIATTTKTNIQVDIDEIATDLNGKADVDLTNVNDTGYIKMAGASMPSDTYVDLTLGASGSTYTAPANGWFYLRKISNATNQQIGLEANNGELVSNTIISTNGGEGNVYVPVKKSDIVKVFYGNTTASRFRFIYAQGSESEAS